jgi:hypothetical protein
MSTVKLFVKRADYMTVMKCIQESGVKYYPVRRYVHFPNGGASGFGGYKLELEKDHPIVSFLILKFDLKTLSDELVQL